MGATALLTMIASGAAAGGGVTGGRPVVEAETPVTPTDLALSAANNSPMLAVDPTDERFVVAAYRLDAPMFGCGLEISGNRGGGWRGAAPVPELPMGAEKCYAPEVVFDRHGTLYYLFVGLAGQGNSPMGAFLTTSTDRGRSFSPPRRVLGPENYMVRLGIDRGAGEGGRLHLIWLQAGADPPLGGLPAATNPVLAAHSDDGGRTFSAPVQVSDPARPRAVAPSLAVGPAGEVHVAYYDLGDDARDYQGLEGPTWPGHWSLVVSSSTDRGRTFGEGSLVTDGIVPPGRVMLIFTMPPASLAAPSSGDLHLAWPDARRGDPDVFVSSRPAGAAAWSEPQRVNDDRGRAATQELPRLDVAPGGRLDLAFLDRRDDPDDRRSHVYYSSSGDGGRTFGPNLRLTAEPSDSRIGQGYRVPSAAGLTERGSRLAVLSRPGDTLVAWPDTRNSTFGTNQQDVFAAVVRWGPAPEEPVVEELPTDLVLAAGLVLVVVAGLLGLLVTRRPRPGGTG